MIHPDTERRFVNSDIGYGVFATRFIPDHDIVIKYSFIDAHSRFVLCWDHARIAESRG